MLTAKPQVNLSNAEGYFREHLATGDYYMDGHVVRGEWRGVAASMLGLEGVVDEKSFLALCEGQHPETGQLLTMRRNTTRREGEHTVSNRRVFYDFTISPPKSVSVVALWQDARIIGLHDRAVRVMVDQLEKFAETRVRKDGENGERVTGGVVTALFRHDTSRELDPHLHTHCVVVNATYDWAEEKWKALHATGMYRAQKFAENLYYHELARGLRNLGYEIVNTPTGFEIQGVPESVVARFSKRHQQIDAETKKRIETEGLRGNEKALRAQVAQDKRRRKIRSLCAEKLRPRWASEMPSCEHAALSRITPEKLPPPLPAVTPEKCGLPGFVTWADAHLFERRSVVGDYELMSVALARGRGQNFSLGELEKAVADRDYVYSENSRKLTSKAVYAREYKIVRAALDGRGRHAPFSQNAVLSIHLGNEQRHAVRRILGSCDFITLFQGGAGTGKTFALYEIARAIDGKGTPVLVVAPQHQQVADLNRNGLKAVTLAQVLTHGNLARGTVVIADEAGQIGGSDMLALIEHVQACGGRIILSGDTRQQGPVAASDALRAIEKHGDVTQARLNTIRRQNPDTVSSKEEKRAVRKYRSAVKAAADGELIKSFDRLDALGWVREREAEDLRKELAREYCAALSCKESVLAVAQTWAEVRALNAEIRQQLRESGKIGMGRQDVPVVSWQSLDLSEAQKRDARFYPADSRVYFVRGYGRFMKGDWGTVAGVDARGVSLLKDGVTTRVGFEQASRFVVTAPYQIELAKGDRLQMKFNGKSAEGAAIRNGELVTVRRVMRDGRIRVRDDAGVTKTLLASQRMFVSGYAVTAYASQGKTVDTVLASYAGDEARPAAVNRNQWYVAISRGRKKAVVFTTDKEALRACVERESDRELALTLEPTPSQKADIARLIEEEHRQRMAVIYEQQRRAAQQQQIRQGITPRIPSPSPAHHQQQSRGMRL
ncbi:relaxase domain-containing protein [Termitidicoccus mucosus]|uniref:MobF family relaxase n=1 Tax=Termitidicoccus mucosus TaxID=1184151 RepID=UPI00083913AF